MKLFNIVLIIGIGLFFTGCSKVIDVKLNTAAPKLVIDASIDWEKNTPGNEQKIIISTTTGYYNEEFPSVSGAVVSVANSAGTVFPFTEGAKPGEYVCTNFVPVVGDTYTLTVTLNGVSYSAIETFTATPEIEGPVIQNDKGGMTGDELEVEFSFQDDGSTNNYYVVGVRSTRIAYPEFNLESDENYQGKKMTQYYSHEDLEKGDSLNIRLYAVSRRFYEYFRKVLTASGDDSGPFPTTPTAARGNIINQADADNPPLGYFRLSEVTIRNHKLK